MVDLPEPLGPVRATNSASSAVKLMLVRAFRGFLLTMYCFETLEMDIFVMSFIVTCIRVENGRCFTFLGF